METKQSRGVFYGVGVGPGDPEEMTLKAVRILREADVILLPAAEKEKCIAYRIAVRSVPSLAEKEILSRAFPMTREAQARIRAHDEISAEVCSLLDTGRSAALITLWDPGVYSTFSYIRSRLQKAGYPVQTVSGVPSFCAAAARLGISLADWSEQIHIIPGGTDPAKTADYPGTRVYMKSGQHLPALKEALVSECETKALRIWCISNCGMETETFGEGAESLRAEEGYLTTVIVREEGEVE